MFSKKTLIKAALIALPVLIIPVIAFAYTTPPLFPNGFWGPLVSCTGDYLQGAQNNQIAVNDAPPATCANLCDLIATFINIIYFAMSIAIFIIVPISFGVGAVMIMVSGANPEMLGTGKKVFTGAAVGLAIVLCSYLLVNTVLIVFNVTAIGGFNGNSTICSVKS